MPFLDKKRWDDGRSSEAQPDHQIKALYLHIPFCHSICPFCAFAVHGNRKALHKPFLQAIQTEISLRKNPTREDDSMPVEAIYLGGGTPSTLAVAEIEELLTSLRRAFPCADDVEIAMEINPEDAQPPFVKGLKALGITRLSVGLQSLDDRTLAALGRRHSSAQSHQALQVLKDHGPGNMNADLMWGAPGIPPDKFLEDVETLISYRPEHISLYGLDVEPGTRFHRKGKAQVWLDENRETLADVYLEGIHRLKKEGYRHYEVSNLCTPGKEGRQNLRVWEGWGYLGLGPGAHSYWRGRRWGNIRHLPAYLAALAAGKLPVAQEEQLSEIQRANEALMLALRREEGFSVQPWCATYGVTWGEHRGKAVKALIAQGFALDQPGGFRLSTKGMLMADAITAELMIGEE